MVIAKLILQTITAEVHLILFGSSSLVTLYKIILSLVNDFW